MDCIFIVSRQKDLALLWMHGHKAQWVGFVPHNVRTDYAPRTQQDNHLLCWILPDQIIYKSTRDFMNLLPFQLVTTKSSFRTYQSKRQQYISLSIYIAILINPSHSDYLDHNMVRYHAFTEMYFKNNSYIHQIVII